jgi:hypothetical protein
MSIVNRLFRGFANIVESSTTPPAIECFRSYKIAAINEFYSTGYLVDKIDSVVGFDLVNLDKINPDNALNEVDKINAFFGQSKFIHIGNLQTLSSLRIGYEYKTIKKDVKLVLDHKTNLIKSNLLDVFTPIVISQTRDYDGILQNIFKYYEFFFVHSKTVAYKDGEINPLYNSALYLEFLSNLKLTKEEYFKLFNSFYATFNYGLASFDAFIFLFQRNIIFQNIVGISLQFALDFKQLEQSVIIAFQKHPDKIDKIQKIHNSSKEIGSFFKSFDELFLLIENYIRINAYSKYDSDSLIQLEPIIEEYMGLLNEHRLRVFCLFTLLNFSETDSTVLYWQVTHCESEIAKINPNLIPNFKVS